MPNRYRQLGTSVVASMLAWPYTNPMAAMKHPISAIVGTGRTSPIVTVNNTSGDHHQCDDPPTNTSRGATLLTMQRAMVLPAATAREHAAKV